MARKRPARRISHAAPAAPRFPTLSRLEISFRRSAVEWLESRLCLSTAYSFDVIAKTGDTVSYVDNQTGPSGTLTAVGQLPSINNSGDVAFVGQYAGGNGVFVGDGTTAEQNITPGLSGISGRTFGGAVQINDAGQVLAVDRASGAPPSYYLRLWNASTGSAQIEVTAGNGSNSLTSIFLSGMSLSNTGGFSYVAFNGASVLLNSSAGTVATLPSPEPTIQPMLADNGDIVARAGSTSSSPVAVYNPASPASFIASASNGFTALGAEPGISDDGSVVAFYGESAQYGNGIFAAVDTANGWTTPQKIAGISGDGHLDPGETFTDTNGDGQLDATEKDAGPFTAFSPDSRVGVSQWQPGLDAATITYAATGRDGQQGIYTSRLSLLQGHYDVGAPSLVAEVGGSITALTGSVASFSSYDPINASGQLAFYVAMTDGTQAIVRADPIRTPVVIVPGILGSYPADIHNDEAFVTHLGYSPDPNAANPLVADPIANVYGGLIQTLENSGYTMGKDLFVATYDWRLPLAPLDAGALSGQYDGTLNGVSAAMNGDVPNGIYRYGTDYLAYWLANVALRWAHDHPGIALPSVDVIAHSMGGLLTRSYIQSDAYGGSLGSVILPKIGDLVMLGVPNQGAPETWNDLYGDNFGLDATSKFLVAGMLDRVYIDVTKKHETVFGPDGTPLITNPTSGTLDPKTFISEYIPSLRSLMPTYGFLGSQLPLQTVNADSAHNNPLLLDLNGGQNNPTSVVTDAHEFATQVHAVALYGTTLSTPTAVAQVNAPGVVYPFETQPVTAPNYYQDISLPNNGDGTVPLDSAKLNDARIDEFPLTNFADAQGQPINHRTIVSGSTDVERMVLDLLGASASASQLTTSGGGIWALLNAAQVADISAIKAIAGVRVQLDPVDGFITDGNGKRLGFSAASGPSSEVPNSFYIGGADGFGVVIGSVTAPLNLSLTGTGNDYEVQVIGDDAGTQFGIQKSGFLSSGETANVSIISALNHPPVLDRIADQDVVLGTKLSLTAHATDFDTGDILTYSLDSGAPAGAAIDPHSGALTWTPTAAAEAGAHAVTVRVTDNGTPAKSDTTSFTITAEPNQAPTFFAGPDQAVAVGAGAQSVAGWATDISPGSPSEASQTLTFVVTGDTNPALFSVPPSVDPATGNLTYTPAPNATGSSDITLVLDDNGGTAGGGQDASAPQTFAIAVTSAITLGGPGLPGNQVDTSFGSGGFAVEDDLPGAPLNLQSLSPQAVVAVEPDGKVLVGNIENVGTPGNTTLENKWLITRFASDGTRDSTFGQNGEVVVDVGDTGQPSYIQLLARISVTPNGQIVVLGAQGAPGETVIFAALRLNSDGSLDRSFGSNGVLLQNALERFPLFSLDRNGSFGAPFAGIQQNGQIIVAGEYDDATGHVFDALTRLNPDGTVDTSYGHNGVAADIAGFGFFDVEILPDGSVLALDQPEGRAGRLIKYTAAGALDVAFGQSGVVTLPDTTRGAPLVDEKLLLQDNGEIDVVGNNGDIAVIRLNSDGTLDSSYGSGGIAKGPPRGELDSAFKAMGATVDRSGRIIVSIGASNTSGQGVTSTIDRFSNDGTHVPQVAALMSLEFPAACIAEPPACALGVIRGAELRAS